MTEETSRLPGPAASRLIPAPKQTALEAASAIIEEVAADMAAQSKVAHDLAAKLEQVFHTGFALPSKGKGLPKVHVFLTTHAIGHHRLSVNRDVAALLASQPVPVEAIEEWFVATGMERRKDMFLALNVHPSTLSRAGANKAMDASVTERMLRHSDLLVRAAEVFGEDGKTWMTKPHDLLDGKTPMEFASNEFGGAKVRAMLNAIEYGGVV